MAKVVSDGRRATVVIDYNGKNIDEYLQKDLMSFSYNDAANGEQDDIQIEMDDREQKWTKAWKPEFGDSIKAVITVTNWDKDGDKKKLPCGTFQVDTVEPVGPPDKVSIKATSIPSEGAAALREKRSKAWEKTKLKSIAEDIAKRAKLKLSYQTSINPSYDRLEQEEQSDFNFLMETASSEGITIKVSNGSLVVFNEEEYEKKPPVFKIVRGKSNVLDYSFENTIANTAYSKCIVEYRSTTSEEKSTVKKTAKKKKAKTVVIRGEYTAPGVKGPVLKITNQQVESTAEANRVAKNLLRKRNKEAGKASFILDGDVQYATGITGTIEGWGLFDGKYIVEQCAHNVGPAYTVSLEIRKVLGY